MNNSPVTSPQLLTSTLLAYVVREINPVHANPSSSLGLGQDPKKSSP